MSLCSCCLWARLCWQQTFLALVREESERVQPPWHRWRMGSQCCWALTLHTPGKLFCLFVFWRENKKCWASLWEKKNQQKNTFLSWDFCQISNKIKTWQIFTISRCNPWWIFLRDKGGGREKGEREREREQAHYLHLKIILRGIFIPLGREILN